jgi:hypothetical protein
MRWVGRELEAADLMGRRPCAHKIRCTELTLSLQAAAIADPVHWVTPSGDGSCSVRVTTVSTTVLGNVGHEPLLPAPFPRLGATHLAHDRKRAHAVGTPQHDPRSLHMLLRAITMRHDRLDRRQ